MTVSHRTIAIVGMAVVLLLAGCLSGGSLGQSPSPTPTRTGTSEASATGCATMVSFYGLDSPGETAWAPNRIAIGYTVQGNASVFFVAFEEGTVLGTTHVTTTDLDYGVTADGDGIPLDDSLTGSHMIRVGAYTDTNDNGNFDLGTDTPCRTNGDVVEAGPRRINFSTLQYSPTPTTKTDSTS